MTTPGMGCGAARRVSMRRGHAALRAMAGKRALYEPRLDQLFAEPIVKQLMHRDRIDEATIRRLLRQASVARAAPSAPRAEGLLALVMGSPWLAHIRYAWQIAVRTIRRRRD
jgi:hypothetical protein